MPVYDYTYDPRQWSSNWDTSAGADLTEIANLHKQLVEMGIAVPDTTALFNEMQNQNRRYASTRNGDAARLAQQARSQILKIYQDAWNTGQQQKAQAGVGQKTQTQFTAPSTTVASDMGPWQGVKTADDFSNYAKLFGFDFGAPASTTPVTGINPSDRSGAATLDNWTVPTYTGTSGTGLTTGQGTLPNSTMPGAVTLAGASGSPATPAAQTATAGLGRTADFAGTTGNVGSTGNAEWDARLNELMMGGGEDAAIKSLENLILQQASGGGVVPDYDFNTLTKDFNTLTESEQAHLDAVSGNIERQTANQMKMAAANAATRGTSGGRSEERMMENLALGGKERLAQYETEYRLGREDAKRSYALEQAKLGQSNLAGIVSAAATLKQLAQEDKWKTVESLINIQAGNLDRQLSAKELDTKYGLMEENVNLLRDQFTEDQRKALVAEGYTDRQITAMEAELQWRSAYELAKNAADHNLAVRNTDISEKVSAREMDITELKNKNDVAINARAQQLAEYVAQNNQMNEEEKLDYMWKTLATEYGINLDKIALARYQATGEFSINMFNAERAYNLDVAAQRDAWMTTAAGMELEERLKMAGYNLEEIMQGKQLDLERDKYLSGEVLSWYGYDWQADQNALNRELEKWKVNKEAEANKGSFVKGLVTTLVGAGAKFVTGKFGVPAGGKTG